MTDQQITGARDEHYNLVSIAYHALHGAWNYDQYIEDAQKADDPELADFFRDVKRQQAEIGNRAKELLAKRIS